MKKRIYIARLLLFLHLILWCTGAYSYEICQTSGGLDIKWNTDNATYYINSSGGPSGSISAIEAGMRTWTEAGSSDFTFISGGTTTSTAHGTNDGTNIATFGLLGVGTVAENAYWYQPSTGRIVDSDVRFNTYYSWSTNGSGGFDLQNVGTHEHGHSLCLKDLYNSADSAKTMYGYVSWGETKKRSLHEDDVDGITYLYPCPNLSARIVDVPPVYYSLIQDAYDNAGTGDTIEGQNVFFTEDIYIDIDKTVIFEGGYICDYTSNPGRTIINGSLFISNGLFVVESGTLKLQ